MVHRHTCTARNRIFGKSAGFLCAAALAAPLVAAGQNASQPQTPVDLIRAMSLREREASQHRERFAYISTERSDRTGGHLWTERVVETANAPIRFLLAEDGKPLEGERARAEQARLAGALARPDDYIRREAPRHGDELRASSLLEKLPDGFIVENVRLENGVWSMNFRPDPGYSWSGVEDHVLHSMSGTLRIDAKDYRLIHLDGRMGNNVSIGFGLLATVQAGSSFQMDKADIDDTWRAVHVVTDLRGKAVFFKTLARSSDMHRADFRHLAPNVTLAQAVNMAEREWLEPPRGPVLAHFEKSR